MITLIQNGLWRSPSIKVEATSFAPRHTICIYLASLSWAKSLKLEMTLPLAIIQNDSVISSTRKRQNQWQVLLVRRPLECAKSGSWNRACQGLSPVRKSQPLVRICCVLNNCTCVPFLSFERFLVHLFSCLFHFLFGASMAAIGTSIAVGTTIAMRKYLFFYFFYTGDTFCQGIRHSYSVKCQRSLC